MTSSDKITWKACGPGRRDRVATLGKHRAVVSSDDGVFVVRFAGEEQFRTLDLRQAQRVVVKKMPLWVDAYETAKAVREAAHEARVQEILAERRGSCGAA